jgi:hypothetical protein
MADIFISYRRSDAGDIAGRIADHLRELPQVDSVFLDVESIGYGEDFVDKINHVISRSETCLLLIGPDWVGPREGAEPRIRDENDFVRMEAAAALAGDINVIPVLLKENTMPTADMLPPDLQDLPRRNAFPLRTAFFAQDIEVLFDDMFGKDRILPGTSLATRLGRRAVKGVIWALMAALLLFAFTFILKVTTDRSLDSLFNYSKAVTLAVMAGVPLLGFLFGFFRRGMKI